MNGTCGTVVGMFMHDSLSRAIMLLINTEQWSSDKAMIRPIRSEANLDSFAETGKNSKREHYLNAKGYFSKIKQKRLL